MQKSERDYLVQTAIQLSELLEKHYNDLMKGVIPNTGGLHHYACAVNDLPTELERIFKRLDEQEKHNG